jgi:alpha,alpha-trehalose phosphorylase
MSPAARLAGQAYDAVLFDLDGVLTETAAIHARCWKETFDQVLAEWERRTRRRPPAFDVTRDYIAHVDGKPRENGVRDFLRVRDVAVPEGAPSSPAGEWSVHGIANAKQALFERALDRAWIGAFPGSVRWVHHLRSAGVRTAVVSSSSNCDEILRTAEIDDLFETTVNGNDVRALGLRGKPAPDGFLEAARRLGVAPRRAIVVEDALAGVSAGAAGGFGLVIGVARGAGHARLRDAGADVVVDDLAELVPPMAEPVHPTAHRVLSSDRARAAATLLPLRSYSETAPRSAQRD